MTDKLNTHPESCRNTKLDGEFNLSKKRENLLYECIKIASNKGLDTTLDDLVYIILREVEKQDKEFIKRLKELINNHRNIKPVDWKIVAMGNSLLEEIDSLAGDKLVVQNKPNHSQQDFSEKLFKNNKSVKLQPADTKSQIKTGG